MWFYLLLLECSRGVQEESVGVFFVCVAVKVLRRFPYHLLIAVNTLVIFIFTSTRNVKTALWSCLKFSSLSLSSI